MVEKSKYCSDVMKKHFNKKLVMTKKDNQDFKNSADARFVITIVFMAMLK